MSMNLGTATAYLEMDTSDFQNGLRSAKQNFRTFMDSTKSASTRINALGHSMKSAGSTMNKYCTLPIANIGTASVGSAMEAEQSFAKVNSILKLNKEHVGGAKSEWDVFSDSMKKGANEIGLGYSEYANACYDAISVGVKQADVTNFMATTNKLAKGGLTDLTTATGLLTTAQNTYGLSQKDLTHVSDVLITTQNLGKVTVAELASCMSSVIPTAKNLGVNVDQLGACYTIMTAQGIKSAEATTYVSSMFNELGKSGTKVDTALKEISGKSFKELMENGHSTGDVLQMLSDYADQSGISLTDLFESSEAGEAALALLKDGGNGFNKVLKEMGNSTGATDKAFNEMNETTKEQLTQSLNKLKNAVSDLGVALLPLVDAIAKGISKFAEWIKKMNETHPKLVEIGTKILLVVAAIGPLLLFVGNAILLFMKLKPVIDLVCGGFGYLKTAFNLVKFAIMYGVIPAIKSLWGFMIAHPITLVIGVIALLVGAFIYCWKHVDGFKEFWIKAWESIKQFCSDAIQAVKDKFNEWGENINTFITETIPNFINGVGEWFSQLPERIGQWLDNTIQNIGTWCEETWTMFLDWCNQVIEGIVEWFSQLPYKIGFALGEVLGTIATWAVETWNFFTVTIPQWIEAIDNWFKELPDRLKKWFDDALNKTIGWGQNMWNKAVETGTNFVNSIIDWFSRVPPEIWNKLLDSLNKAKQWVSDMWDKAKENGQKFLDATRQFFSQLPDKVKDWFNKTINNAKQFATDMWNKGKEAAKKFGESLVNGLKSIPDKVVNIGKSIVEGLWKGIKNSASWLYNQISSFAQGVIDGFKKSFKINSPSKIMRDVIGVGIVEGIEVGMNKRFNSLLNVADNIATKTTDAMSKNINDFNFVVPYTATFDSSSIDDAYSFLNSDNLVSSAFNTTKMKINSQNDSLKNEFRNVVDVITNKFDESIKEIANLVTDKDVVVNLDSREIARVISPILASGTRGL